MNGVMIPADTSTSSLYCVPPSAPGAIVIQWSHLSIKALWPYKRRSKNVPLTGLDEVRSFRSKSVPVLMGPRERGPEDEVSGDIWEGPSGHIG